MVWIASAYGTDLSGLIGAAPLASTYYIAEGDSITYGPDSDPTKSYAYLFANSDTTNITFFNAANPGNTLASFRSRISEHSTRIASNSGKVNYVLSILIGTNDINTSGYYPSGAAAFLSDYANALDSLVDIGVTGRVVCTILPRLGTGSFPVTQATFDAWAATVNAGIRAFEGVHCEKVVDLAAHSIMGNNAATADTTLYIDGLHPTILGHQYIEHAIATALNSQMGVAAAPGATPVTWNASDKDSSVTLSNSLRLMTDNSGTVGSVRATASKTTGKWHYEFKLTGLGYANPTLSFGLATSAFTLSGGLGDSSVSAGYSLNSGTTKSAEFTLANAGTTYSGIATENDIYIIEVDYDAGKIWKGKNGTMDGSPATGSTPWLTFTPSGAAFFPAATAAFGPGMGNVRLPATAVYTPSSGFSVGNA